MMDSEKLIEQLRSYTYWLGQDGPESHDIHPLICDDAATALSTLQAENERLRKELEYEREHANAYHEECGQWEAENEKLRAELEQKEKYYEQMIDALSATDSADLAQMTACVYYKPGGLCRYGGDDPANVCVLGPCPHERTAEEVLADLARVTSERDAAVEDISSVLANAEEIRRGYGVDNADADAAFADLCGNYCAKCGNNCYEEAEDYRCKNFKWRGI